MDGDDGSIAHAELTLNGAVISLATVWRDGGFSTPHELGGVHSQTTQYTVESGRVLNLVQAEKKIVTGTR